MLKIILGVAAVCAANLIGPGKVYDLVTNQKRVSDYTEALDIVKALEDGKVSRLEESIYRRDGYTRKYNRYKKIRVKHLDRYRYVVGKHRLNHFLCRDKRVKYSPTTYAIINHKLLEKVMLIDKASAGQFFITSGHRTPTYNATLTGATKNSRHLEGRAVDLIPINISLKELGKIIRSIEKQRPDLRGYMHIYEKHIHTDVRE